MALLGCEKEYRMIMRGKGFKNVVIIFVVKI